MLCLERAKTGKYDWMIEEKERKFVPLNDENLIVFPVVVLAASIITKSGKALVSRQFVDMSRIRIEGLLAAFPKLVGTGKQHTYVETENVRYVYQPIELLYLLVVTNKQSNILEDLETLRLLSKLVPEYALSLDEEGICKSAFELIFAFDEVISLGHKENVTVAQVKQYCEMESHEERLHKLVMQSKINETKDVMKRKASEIDKSKIEKGRADKGGFMSLQSMGSGRIESSFSDMSISSGGGGGGTGGFGSGSGFGLSSDIDSFSSKPKGRPTASATAPPKGLGMKLGKTQRTNQFLESLKAEGEVILEDVQPTVGQSRSAAPPPTDPITLTIEEKLNVTLKRDGGVNNFDVQGILSLQILNKEDGHIQVQIESGGNPGILFKTHPNINKELFSNENILGMKDPERPFPSGQTGDAAGVGLLRWRMQTVDESVVPLTINCWPSVSGNETYVSIEYEASSMFDLRNVVISVPLPALRDAPNVRQIDGEWRYDSRNSILEWSILLIDNSNRSGSMEFVVPPADSSAFFPISVQFTAASTFSDVKVVNVLPSSGGPPPKFSQRTQLITENYQVDIGICITSKSLR
ncbi:Mu homology domain [Dillenia turbinata]|uniref:Coatomer subunit delta n=1 Tax=Dillenia turbinata TaxID=194707 RepID=A0AAN8VV86_9MAGN